MSPNGLALRAPCCHAMPCQWHNENRAAIRGSGMLLVRVWARSQPEDSHPRTLVCLLVIRHRRPSPSPSPSRSRHGHGHGHCHSRSHGHSQSWSLVSRTVSSVRYPRSRADLDRPQFVNRGQVRTGRSSIMAEKQAWWKQIVAGGTAGSASRFQGGGRRLGSPNSR